MYTKEVCYFKALPICHLDKYLELQKDWASEAAGKRHHFCNVAILGFHFWKPLLDLQWSFGIWIHPWASPLDKMQSYNARLYFRKLTPLSAPKNEKVWLQVAFFQVRVYSKYIEWFFVKMSYHQLKCVFKYRSLKIV